MAYTITQIIEAANKQTERRAEGKLDLRVEFLLMLQELLHENRFWWARKTLTFNTAVGTATYGLDAATITGAGDVEEIIRAWRIDSATEKTELAPIIGEDGQAAALEATTNADPASYMLQPGAWQTLRLGAPANAVKKVRVFYWAGVNPDYDATDETVPLVPGPLHYGLVVGLKRRILDFLYGQNDPRYLVADRDWQKFIRNAARKGNFTPQAFREFSQDEDAVQAHV